MLNLNSSNRNNCSNQLHLMNARAGESHMKQLIETLIRCPLILTPSTTSLFISSTNGFKYSFGLDGLLSPDQIHTTMGLTCGNSVNVDFFITFFAQHFIKEATI